MSSVPKSISNPLPGYLLDPHTSVAKTVADRLQQDRPTLIVSTAHPGKFAHDVLGFLGHGSEAESTQPPSTLISKVETMAPLPGVHRNLARKLSTGVTKEKLTCENSFEGMVSEVHKMAKTIS